MHGAPYSAMHVHMVGNAKGIELTPMTSITPISMRDAIGKKTTPTEKGWKGGGYDRSDVCWETW